MQPSPKRFALHDGDAAESPGEYLNDLLAFDTALGGWEELSPSGRIPPPRVESGLASLGGALYLFGGAQENVNSYGDAAARFPLVEFCWSCSPHSGPGWVVICHCY